MEGECSKRKMEENDMTRKVEEGVTLLGGETIEIGGVVQGRVAKSFQDLSADLEKKKTQAHEKTILSIGIYIIYEKVNIVLNQNENENQY